MAFFSTKQNRQMRQQLVLLRPKLHRVACAWCGSPHLADDLVQETLLKALGKLHQLKDAGSLNSWIFSILANCHRDALRGQRYSEEEYDPEVSPQASAEEEAALDQRVERVRQAIRMLSPGQREVMMLVDLEGFSYAEVAGILQLPIGTVMSRLNRGRRQLRTLLVDGAERRTAKVVPLERVK